MILQTALSCCASSLFKSLQWPCGGFLTRGGRVEAGVWCQDLQGSICLDFLVEKFLTNNSAVLLVIDLLRFSISSSVSLVICVFPGICQFHLGYLICWHDSCLSYFSKSSNNVTTLIPDVSDLHPLIFLCQFSCRFVSCFLVSSKATFSFIYSLL